MIKCKPYRCEFLKPDTCITRQSEMVGLVEKIKEMEVRKKADKSKPITTDTMRRNTAPSRYTEISKCHGCKTGLDLYQKFLKGEIVIESETKKCPCGAVITRWKGQNAASWHRVKYCQEHSKLNQAQKKNLREKTEKPVAKPKEISSTRPLKVVSVEKQAVVDTTVPTRQETRGYGQTA